MTKGILTLYCRWFEKREQFLGFGFLVKSSFDGCHKLCSYIVSSYLLYIQTNVSWISTVYYELLVMILFSTYGMLPSLFIRSNLFFLNHPPPCPTASLMQKPYSKLDYAVRS